MKEGALSQSIPKRGRARSNGGKMETNLKLYWNQDKDREQHEKDLMARAINKESAKLIQTSPAVLPF